MLTKEECRAREKAASSHLRSLAEYHRWDLSVLAIGIKGMKEAMEEVNIAATLPYNLAKYNIS